MIPTRPLPVPVGGNATALAGFGRIVEFDPSRDLTPEEFTEIETLLYEYSLLLFPNATMTPESQLKLTQAFQSDSGSQYGHGNNSTGQQSKSILHPDLKTLPHTPQVQLIGNGHITDPRITAGLPIPVPLKHPSHQSFHQKILSDADSARGLTRFYRWHIDAALYNLDPPKVTTLLALEVPEGPRQTVRYDDGTGDELEVSIGGTSFVSGRNMFNILPAPLKSLAVRAHVRYAPHPYIWMSSTKAMSTGLGIVSEGKELSRDELPPVEADKIKTYPMLWKNPVTGGLHLQVHPCAIESIIVDALPTGVADTPNTLYPEGAHLTDLAEVRALMYNIQRPAIAPEFVYTHDWKPNDLVLFHNRGVLHSITGAFKAEEKRAFWQCNLASDEPPVGPSVEDVLAFC